MGAFPEVPDHIVVFTTVNIKPYTVTFLPPPSEQILSLLTDVEKEILSAEINTSMAPIQYNCVYYTHQ